MIKARRHDKITTHLQTGHELLGTDTTRVRLINKMAQNTIDTKINGLGQNGKTQFTFLSIILKFCVTFFNRKSSKVLFVNFIN